MTSASISGIGDSGEGGVDSAGDGEAEDDEASDAEDSHRSNVLSDATDAPDGRGAGSAPSSAQGASSSSEARNVMSVVSSKYHAPPCTPPAVYRARMLSRSERSESSKDTCAGFEGLVGLTARGLEDGMRPAKERGMA